MTSQDRQGRDPLSEENGGMPDSNISLIAANDVASICRDFFASSEVNCFSYSRVYKDGSRSELWSDARALRHTFIEKKYIVGSYTPAYYRENERYAILENKVESFSEETRKRYVAQIADQKNLFDYSFPFKLINLTDEYCEYFIFYSSASNANAISFYLNNLDVLENFVVFFKFMASDLIARVVKTPLIVSPMSKIEFSTELVETGCFSGKFLPSECRLTPRQIQIAQHIMVGRTAREIAQLLLVSPRTIETHVENMKSRMGCINRAELILRFSDMAISTLTSNKISEEI